MNASQPRMADAIMQQIKAERAAQGLTVQQLAEVSGVKYPTLRRYLTDERVMPLDFLESLITGLGIDPTVFIARALERLGD